jgi:hypothetical protein
VDELARIIRLEERVQRLSTDLRDLELELGYGPAGAGPLTLRGRVHVLESSEAAARAAAAATELARSAIATQQGRKWSTRERVAAVALGLWMALLPTVNLVLNLRGR